MPIKISLHLGYVQMKVLLFLFKQTWTKDHFLPMKGNIWSCYFKIILIKNLVTADTKFSSFGINYSVIVTILTLLLLTSSWFMRSAVLKAQTLQPN